MTALTMRTALTAFLLAIPGTAQEPTPTPIAHPAARSDDAVVARIANPARLRAALLSTTVGDILGGEDGEVFRSQFAGTFDGLLQSLDPQFGALLAAAADAVGDDAGTWTVGIQPGPPFAGSLELQPGRGSDPDALRTALQRALQESGAPLDTLDRGPEQDPVAYLTFAGHGVTLPRLERGRIRIDWGSPFAAAFAARQREGDAWQPAEPAQRRAPVLVEFRLQQLLDRMDETLHPKVRAEFLRLLGVSSLDRLRVRARANGPYLEFQSELSFLEGIDRGVFAGLFPALSEPPALVGLLPEDTGTWQALPFDMARTWRSMIDSFARYSAGPEITTETAIAGAKEQERTTLGQVLDEGFLGHLDPHGLFLGRLDDEDARSFLAAFRIDDPTATERDWDRMLAGVDPFLPGVKSTFEYRDEVVHCRNDLCRVVTADLFVFAWGEGSRDAVRALLDRRAELRRDELPWTTLPAAVQRRLGQTPPGFHGCGSVGTNQLLGVEFVTEILELPDALSDALGTGWVRALEEAEPKLLEAGVERAVSLSGWDPESRTWRYRILW